VLVMTIRPMATRALTAIHGWRDALDTTGQQGPKMTHAAETDQTHQQILEAALAEYLSNANA
jgi:hypothetical protein